MTALKSLEDYNRERRSAVFSGALSVPVPNGIACPTCGAELLDTSPGQMYMSYPAQKAIHCNGCGYRGYRIA